MQINWNLGKLLFAAGLALTAGQATAQILVQCPGDTNGDGISDTPGIVCLHMSSGDGFVRMANGHLQYIFGFSNLSGVRTRDVMTTGALAANFPAPAIALDEGDQVYLNLTNVGFIKRPDLFDPHTVHFHGFPQASAIFDGLPESAIAINVGATATYYYKLLDPGTYMYHCHAEATEHMQMGMLGNFWVRPKQNKYPNGTVLNGFTHVNTNTTKYTYAYNDDDGTTRYDVERALHISSFDQEFHDASLTVQPLPFALMEDDYPLLNGRGYPDTVNPAALTPPEENGGKPSQVETSLIQARAGQKVLLRLSNLNVTRTYSVGTLGIPMKVVGRDARIYRGPSPGWDSALNRPARGKNLYHTVNSITLGSGETADVLLDTTGVAPGTYFLYSTQLNFLSNYGEDFGGMMTEIRVTAN